MSTLSATLAKLLLWLTTISPPRSLWLLHARTQVDVYFRWNVETKTFGDFLQIELVDVED